MRDRDGAFRITAALRGAFSTITLVWADVGYAGRFVRGACKIWDLAMAIPPPLERPPVERTACRDRAASRWGRRPCRRRTRAGSQSAVTRSSAGGATVSFAWK
ncbi:hypothetical protein Msi02_44880 [Microbispora siamensis]|uniref:Transposase DDE domain-containing protein n=1 Tax=Microbispora siamensis TaxID=564413 RepID=A0ABQ4GQG0_9ACTN|nr:hypothetical protein Msi02_44880 [Microbispora siamensis]